LHTSNGLINNGADYNGGIKNDADIKSKVQVDSVYDDVLQSLLYAANYLNDVAAYEFARDEIARRLDCDMLKQISDKSQNTKLQLPSVLDRNTETDLLDRCQPETQLRMWKTEIV